MNSAVNDVPYSILKAYVETKSTVTRLLTAVATTKRILLFSLIPSVFHSVLFFALLITWLASTDVVTLPTPFGTGLI